MKKQLESAFMLAGTAIGSGMLSLPLVLAKFGIINTCIIMAFFAFFTCLTAFIRADLNLNVHAGATLTQVGEAIGSDQIGIIGDMLLKLLSFALMSAYIFGFSSILHLFIGISHKIAMIVSSFGIFLTFIFAEKIIICINKYLFIALFISLLLIIIWLFAKTPIEFVPQQENGINLRDWTTLMPIVFTSFGFQGSIHSVTKFCENDRKMIRSACIWGSIIPALVYMVWTVAILVVVANAAPNFFQSMLDGRASDVGELVVVLSRATSSNENMQKIVWIVSVLAILTSVFGVGTAILDIFDEEKQLTKRWQAVTVAVFTPTIVAMLTPNAFIKILNISGMILATIAVIVPIIMLLRMRQLKLMKCKPLLKNEAAIITIFAVGIIIITCGIAELL